MPEKKVKKLVADTAAFIKNAQMQEISEVVYTIRSVVDEIRCTTTKARLRVLPYEIKMVEPSLESIHFVTEFSKKTGDYASLSATDIQVMALTYQLEVEANSHEHLNKEPKFKRTVTMGTKPPPSEQKVEKVAGFFMPKVTKVDELADGVEEITIKEEKGEEQDEEYQDINTDEEETCESAEEEEEEEEEEDEVDDEDDGWITPANLDKAKNSMNGVLETVQIDVACLTTDFAMQNVLMQIGLHVVSLEGRLIHEVRTYILRCYGCFRTTSNVSKVFCPKCGHKTLKKVGVSLNEDGTLKIHISTRKQLTARGKKFSLPTPKGGKYAVNPILVENQREAQQRATQLGRTRTNALDPDYVAGNSPFAVNDVYSRAAQLGRTGRTSQYWNRRNPNEVRKTKR